MPESLSRDLVIAEAKRALESTFPMERAATLLREIEKGWPSTERIDYDPVEDESRLFTANEWRSLMHQMLAQHELDLNPDARTSSATWRDWMNGFIRWSSW